jgi:hypothetical protein
MHRETEHHSSTHACMKNNSLFSPINVEISFNTKTRLQVMTSLHIQTNTLHAEVSEGKYRSEDIFWLQ